MLVPRTVSIRRKGSARQVKLPSLAEANLLYQQATRIPVIDSNTLAHTHLDRHDQESAGETRSTDEQIETHRKSDDIAAIPTFMSGQRSVLEEKPKCVVCDRCGEHLCDIKGHIICSMECNQLNTSARGTVLYGPSNIMAPNVSSPRAARATTSSHAPSYSNNRMITNITGYRDSPRTIAMSTKDIRNLRAAHQIHIQGKKIPKPIQSFEDCGLPTKMLSNLSENGYREPRGVQMQVVPAGLYGRDMIISAETGAGKTAGYLIPTLTHTYGLSQIPEDTMEGPYALILTPTRELAMQIEDVIKVMVRGMPNMRTGLLVGGQAMANQVHRLKQNIQIAVATPGRMVDILAKHEEISFSNVFCLVLDEVDLMLSMGFRKQVKRILDVLPEPPYGRQSIVCSATISRQVEQLVAKLMHDDLRIRLGDVDGKAAPSDKPSVPKMSDVFSPSSQIKQTVIWVENESKKKQLLSLLKDPSYFRPPVLVFVESRIGADLLAHMIQVKCPGITAVSMHGEKTQEERSAILRSFMDGAVPVVVATGLLARGLDLKVATVINFDMAPSIQEYVHRVGRANAEAATKAASGIRKGPKLGGMAWAITFINNDHHSILGEFANMLHGLGLERVTPLPLQLKQLIVPDSSIPTPVAQLSSPRDKASDGTKLSSIKSSKRKGMPQQLGSQTKLPRPNTKRQKNVR